MRVAEPLCWKYYIYLDGQRGVQPGRLPLLHLAFFAQPHMPRKVTSMTTARHVELFCLRSRQRLRAVALIGQRVCDVLLRAKKVHVALDGLLHG